MYRLQLQQLYGICGVKDNLFFGINDSLPN